MARRLLPVSLALLAALLLAAPATAGWTSDGRAIGRGLTSSVRHGKLTRAEASRFRLQVRRTRAVLPRLSWTRAANLGAVLHDVARQSRRFSRPRALTLFGMLRTNRKYLARRPMPPYKADVTDANGILYRSFPGSGLQFHPLGTFGKLNARLKHGDLRGAARLASAMRARGIHRSGGRVVWEYEWYWGGGTPPWTSGMAQAVGAQAMARAAARLGRHRLMRAATGAYRSVRHGLTLHLVAGPWIQHYSFAGLVVLNAQLQTAISIRDYADLARNRRARRFAGRLRRTSSRMLPRFDTGYWTLYSPGVDSPLSYHEYVVSLLRKLEENTGNPRWGVFARRFDRYTHQPPKVVGGPTLERLYPVPLDGFRDRTALSFWLSKPATVSITVAGERRSYAMRAGRHVVPWSPGGRRPGSYRPFVRAVDWAGNVARLSFDPIRILRDTTPPQVVATRTGRELDWRATDRGTPWVRLKLRLVRPSSTRVVALGIHSLRGSLRLPRLRARWEVKLVVKDSSGNRTRIALGLLGGGG